MKKITCLILAAVLITGCASSGTSVYTNPGSIIEVGTEYSFTDLRKFADAMVTDMLSNKRLFTEGRTPTIILGRIENKTTQHIDMGAILSKIEVGLINSGMVKTVSRKALGAIAAEQALTRAMGTGIESNLMGGQYRLEGEMTEIPQRRGRIRTYRLGLWLIDNSTSEKVWAGEEVITKRK